MPQGRPFKKRLSASQRRKLAAGVKKLADERREPLERFVEEEKLSARGLRDKVRERVKNR